MTDIFLGIIALLLFGGGYTFYQLLASLVDILSAMLSAFDTFNQFNADMLDLQGDIQLEHRAWRDEDKDQQQRDYEQAFERAASLASFTAERASALASQAQPKQTKRSHHKKPEPPQSEIVVTPDTTDETPGYHAGSNMQVLDVPQEAAQYAPTEVLAANV